MTLFILARALPGVWLGARLRPRRWWLVGVAIGLMVMTWGVLR